MYGRYLPFVQPIKNNVNFSSVASQSDGLIMLDPNNDDPCPEWEQYPSSRRFPHEDLDVYQKRLIEDAPRLFMPQTISFMMLRVLTGNDG